jgi:hypothetical protein
MERKPSQDVVKSTKEVLEKSSKKIDAEPQQAKTKGVTKGRG